MRQCCHIWRSKVTGRQIKQDERVLGWSAMLVVASTSVVEPWRVLAWTVDLFVNGPLGWARENDDGPMLSVR